jgi:hypothetical protein
VTDSRLAALAGTGSAIVHGEALEVLRSLADGCAPPDGGR